MFGWFSKGKMQIQLSNYQFRPGDVIEGKLVFTLKKPQHVNAVNVQLYGTKRITTYSAGKRTTRSQKIFDFTQPLDGEKDMGPGQSYEYPFKINIPTSVGEQSMPEGIAGSIVKAASLLSRSSASIKWYLKGRVDIPKAIDLTKNVRINVG